MHMHIMPSIELITDITLPTSESGPPDKPPPPRPGPPPPRPGPPPSRPAQPPSRPAAPPSRPKQPPSRPAIPPSPRRPPVPEQPPQPPPERGSEMEDEPEKPLHPQSPGTSTLLRVLCCVVFICKSSQWYYMSGRRTTYMEPPFLQNPKMQSVTSLHTVDVPEQI